MTLPISADTPAGAAAPAARAAALPAIARSMAVDAMGNGDWAAAAAFAAIADYAAAHAAAASRGRAARAAAAHAAFDRVYAASPLGTMFDVREHIPCACLSCLDE